MESGKVVSHPNGLFRLDLNEDNFWVMHHQCRDDPDPDNWLVMFKYEVVDQTLDDCLATCRQYEAGIYPEVRFLHDTAMVVRKVLVFVFG